MLFNSLCYEVPGDISIHLFNIPLSIFNNSLTIYLNKPITFNHKYINKIYNFLFNLDTQPNHIFFKLLYNHNINNY